MSAPYPWLAETWAHLLRNKSQAAQAMLISGPVGVGKRALARAWAKTLLCEAPRETGEACDQCGACHWFEAGTHPDYRELTLQEKENKEGETKLATAIDVEQARDTIDYVQLSTYRAGRRVVVVDPADALNLPAANALLKVLEEPPLNTCFVLISDQARRLLPTLRSRCTKVDVGLPDTDVALEWLRDQHTDDADTMLALAGGAPLVVADWQDDGEWTLRSEILEGLAELRELDPVALAEQWKVLNPRTWQRVAYKWLCDVLAARLACKVRFNPDFAEALHTLGKRANLSRLLGLAQTHAQAARYVMHPLNRQLQLETWLIEYRHIFEEGKT